MGENYTTPNQHKKKGITILGIIGIVGLIVGIFYYRYYPKECQGSCRERGSNRNSFPDRRKNTNFTCNG
jgi:hypothetical protein